jgi:hypothetical protein
MNHHNVWDLARFVVGERDREETKRFYELPAGMHDGVQIIDVSP